MPGDNAETSSALDEAFERLAFAGFELPNGFVNHGAMACEALAALGFEDELDGWARRFARVARPAMSRCLRARSNGPKPSVTTGNFQSGWATLAEEIEGKGWPAVVEVWVPRLMPALATALFHGAIRAGHAVRAVSAADTTARRQELARALGYWAARFRPGQPAGGLPEVADVQAAVVAAAATGAGYYVAEPNIFHLHGVTGAMAVELLGALSLPRRRRRSGASPGRALGLVFRSAPGCSPQPDGAPGRELARAAEASLDPHQVKLVEACRRGSRLSGDPVFATAAEIVTGV